MPKAIPCVVCGKMTTKLLFRDKTLGVPVCSRNCEYQYLRKLTPDRKEQINMVRFLDETIEENKKYNRILWGVSGCGLVPIFVGIWLANAMLFLIGASVAAISALSTRHFEEKIDELMEERMRIVI
jgi:hypothetical protein